MTFMSDHNIQNRISNVLSGRDSDRGANDDDTGWSLGRRRSHPGGGRALAAEKQPDTFWLLQWPGGRKIKGCYLPTSVISGINYYPVRVASEAEAGQIFKWLIR